MSSDHLMDADSMPLLNPGIKYSVNHQFPDVWRLLLTKLKKNILPYMRQGLADWVTDERVRFIGALLHPDALQLPIRPPSQAVPSQ
jgi:hypothetical protein